MVYRIAFGIQPSPTFGDHITLYFRGSTQRLSLAIDEWQFIQELVEAAPPFTDDLRSRYTALRQSFRLGAPSTLDQYLITLQQRGVLVSAEREDQSDTLIPVDNESHGVPKFGSVSEPRGTLVFHFLPSYSTPFRNCLATLCRLQWLIIAPSCLLLLLFLIGALAAPEAYLLGGDESVIISNASSMVLRVAIALLGVNLLSSLSCLWTQSVFGRGDGNLYFRLVYGFLPRFGLNYDRPHDDRHLSLGDKVLIVGQPLFIRIYLIVGVSLLIRTGKVHGGFQGGATAQILLAILHASLLSLADLSFPFWQSPGYRLLTTVTPMPHNYLGSSAQHTVPLLSSFWRALSRGDGKALGETLVRLSERRHLLRVGFTLGLIGFVLLESYLLLSVAIPRLATAMPPVFGFGTPSLIWALFALLLIRFLYEHISNLRRAAKAAHRRGTLAAAKQPGRKTSRLWWLLLLLLLPYPQMVSGSVVVQGDSTLTLRAPAAGEVVRLYVQGPSARLMNTGDPLAVLQSDDLSALLSELESKITDLNARLEEAEVHLRSDRSRLTDLQRQLKMSDQSVHVYDEERHTAEDLALQGALSRTQVNTALQNLLRASGDRETLLSRITEVKASIEGGTTQMRTLQSQRQTTKLKRDQTLDNLKSLTIQMPFQGIVVSNTDGLLSSRLVKGATVLEVRQSPLTSVEVLIADHDKDLVKPGQQATVRLYSRPLSSLSAEVQAVSPVSKVVDQQPFFTASLKLTKQLPAELSQSNGAARIETGRTLLITQLSSYLVRFFQVDVWSWLP